jgi:putative transcriptional regulator
MLRPLYKDLHNMNLSGKLLISPPKVRGNFWQKTVIFLTENHRRGSVGLVLNKRSQMSITEFASQNNVILDIPGFVHVGGPVNVKALTMLHTNEWACNNTMQINNEFSLSSSDELLSNLAMGNCPRQWRLFVGLCGWTAGQLENEIQGNPPYDHDSSWITATATQEMVFSLDQQTQWTQSIEHAGSEFAQKILF